MKRIGIIDTNIFVAAADRGSREFTIARDFLRRPRMPVVVPVMCVAEACYMIQSRFGARAEIAFFEGIRLLDIRPPEPEDWERIAELVRQYANFPLGGTDASIVALAERLESDTIITLDRRHFEAVTPKHCERFRLLPEVLSAES